MRDAVQKPLIWAFPPQPAWDERPAGSGFVPGPHPPVPARVHRSDPRSGWRPGSATTATASVPAQGVPEWDSTPYETTAFPAVTVTGTTALIVAAPSRRAAGPSPVPQ
jgi:hypothetical protein